MDAGRREESEAALVQALEINDSVGDWRQGRRMLATVARHRAASGHNQQALVDLAEATRTTTEPDPVGDIFVALMHTDVLLELGAPVEAVAAAAEPSLRASARYGIDSSKVATTRANPRWRCCERDGWPTRLRTSTSGPTMARGAPTGRCTSSVCTSTYAEACSRRSSLAAPRCARGFLAPSF